MPFDDSLIGNNDFDPKTATEDLIRRVSDEPLPETLEPRMLNTRLARKLGREPAPVEAITPTSKTTKQPDLDFSEQAIPAGNMEPGGKDALDFTSQVTPPPPAPPALGVTGNLSALAKGVPTGAVEGVGGVMKGAAQLYNQAEPWLAAQEYDVYGNPTGEMRPMKPAKPIDQNALYQAGQTVSGAHPNMTDQERDSIGGRVGTMVGGIAPYAVAAAAGGPALGIAAGFSGMGADTYGKVFEDAKAKGADDATAQIAAGKAATAAGILGSLPLGTGKLAQSIIGKVASQGALFATTNEATEYVLQEIAKDYDEKAGYTPEAKRIIASLITGGLMGGLHSFERKKPETRIDSESDTSGAAGPSPEGLPPGGGPFGQQRQSRDNGDGTKTWWSNPPGSDEAGTGPQPGPQGGPQPGGARTKPGEQQQGQKPGEAPKGEGEEVPDDLSLDPKMRSKMERVFRTFERGKDPSTMSDAELFRAVNEHLRDTSSTGYTAKGDSAEEKAQRDTHAQKRTEDSELKAAFGWMTDAQISMMTPDMRAVWLNRARSAKSGGQQESRDANARTQRVAENEAAVPQSEQQGLRPVRRPGDRRVPGVEGELPGVSGGHGAATDTATHAGAGARERGVSPEQLRMGDKGASGSESSGIRNPADVSGQNQNDRGMGGRTEDQPSDAVSSLSHAQVAGGKDFGGASARAQGRRGNADASGQNDERGSLVSGNGDQKEHATPASEVGLERGAGSDGTRSSPIFARTADDVLAAQADEPTAAQAAAENYRHSHLELPQFGLTGNRSISIETGVGQKRLGPPDTEGKPSWEVTMEHGAYGRIKGTKGADGQPLDVFVGPHPQSHYAFIIDQHDPATGDFDEHKIMLGYRTPIDALHAYANSYDDGARDRIGHVSAMSPDQFKSWLEGDTTKRIGSRQITPSKSIATSPGLHNAGEVARRPLTEASTEAAVADVPKGSQGRDANEAIPRPAGITTQDFGRSAASENLSLLEFLADRGGIAPHPELEAIGFGGMHRVQIPGRKGFFGLIKKGGWDLDTAREAAEEMGYLQGDSDNVTSTIRHLLDAMDTEARGNKLYPYQGEGQRTKTEQTLAAEREAYEQSRAQEIEDELSAAGYGEVAGELRQRALRHVTLGMDPDTAIQTAMAEMDAEHVVETPAEFDAIYGDGAYDEVLAGIPYEGGPTSSGQSSEDHWSYEDALDRVGARAPDHGAEDGDGRSEEAADDQGAGRDETTAEGGPVRESAGAERDTAGRREAAGDETGDTARHQPTAEDADDAEGRVEPRYDYDGASEKVQASDSDETVTVTLTLKGPWDFSETFPAPDPKFLRAIDTEGRWPFDSLDASVEEIADKVDGGVYDMMGEVGAIRATDLQIDGVRSGKIKGKGKKWNAEAEIAALKKHRAQLADGIRQLQGVFDEVFGRKAADAMMAEARKRLVDEERLAGKAKADEPRKIAEFIKYIEAEIGAGKMDAEISPTRSLDAFHKAAEARGWTYAAYGKGKALWSPDRQHVIFSSVSVEGNHVTAQWGTPSEGITPPGGTELATRGATNPKAKRKTSALKSAADRVGADANLLRDAVESAAFRKGGLYSLDAPRQREVLASVFSAAQDQQVLKAVIESVPVDVMDMLTGGKPPADSLFHNEAVFRDLLAANGATPIPLGVDAASALVSAVARASAVGLPPSGIAGKPKDGGAAARAGNGDHSPTVEQTPEGMQQVIPGAEKASDKTMAQRGAEAPLKPKANQKPADDGLFGDSHKQTDLLDMVNAKPSPKTNSDNFDAIFDEAINEQFAKPVSLDQATEGLKAIFAKKPAGLAESESPFSDDTYAQALPYLKAGVASFASAGDLPTMVRALVSHLANAGMDADAIRAMKPYIRRFTDEVRSGKETINAPSRREVLERDRSNADAQDGVGAADVPAAAGATERGTGSRGGEADAGDQRSASGERLPQDYAPVMGERGHLEIPEREPVVDDSDAAAPEPERSADGGSEGFQFDQRADGEAEEAAQRSADLNARRKAQADADAKRIPLKHGDLANIAATLPMLFPEQHDDVRAAEERFAKTDGHGMLFTNGTGTGKTYSGLGIIKRFALAGKKQAIVIAPSQGILMDWQKSARDMGLDMHLLDSTVDKGRPGLNGTTYANFGDNAHLVDHEWDLIVPDEAHKLSSDQDGSETKALATLRALTFHPGGLNRRAEMVLRDLFSKIPPAQEKASPAYTANRNRALKEFYDKSEPLIREWRDLVKRSNKAAFLSATPFAYHFSLDWAEGYLFDFDRSKDGSSAYNAPDGRDSFYMQHLGYRKRTGKLTKPDAEVKQEVMERQLHEYLKKTGSLAGRMLTVDKDYDRKFILAHDAVGNQIDQALAFLQDNEAYRPLVDYVEKRFDYLTRMRLLEAIKARAAIDYINQSLALGRKVVVFHDYNEGGGINPFDLTFSDDAKATRYSNGKHEDVALKPLYEEFVRQNPYVKELKFSDYPAPIATLTAAFPKALTYNGTVSKKKRDAAKALFNDDNSGHDLIIVQSAAGEAGISLHDTTGKHQRVTLNLGMPIRPVSSIQQEGRIYRVGQASDAMFRYMNTGTDWERWTFAGKIADRAGTAENLALGNQARTIRQAFIDAFANADDNRPEAGEGTGGKAADRAVTHSMSEFEKAKTHYYAQAKVKGRRDQREGTDYYATPEPLGLKMVEWANVKSGEKILEPSAGHGAIARYFPEDTHRTLVEPSSSLASRASLNSPGARVVAERFENLDTAANKFDAIVMNPPFGVSGKTAIEHVAKAAKHLRNGGRIVALIPVGAAAMDVRLDKFMDSPAAKGLYLVARINLPSVTFERAGTSIATRVVVLEKQTDPEVAQKLQQQDRDYSSAETVGELFDAIENSEISDRLEPKTKDVDAPANGGITIDGVELGLTAERDGTPYAVLKNKLGIDKFKQVMRAAEANDGYYLKTAKMIRFKDADGRQKFLEALANPPKEAEAPTSPSGVTFKTAETVHGKTGAKVFVAVPDQRVERDIYNQMATTAKGFGGYYSSFKGGKAIPGFQFTTEADRAKFIAKLGGSSLGESEAPLGSAPPNRIDNRSFGTHLEDFERSRGPRQGAAAQDFTLQMGRRTGNEWLAAVGPDGRVIAAYEGTAKSISFTPEVEQLLRTPGADIVAHHNHPSGRSLSAPDVSILALPGVSAVWAHGHNGNIYRVALTPEARKSLPADVDQARVKLYKLWNVVAGNLTKMMEPAVHSGAVSFDDANMAHGQIVMEMLRDAGIVDYQTNTDPVALIPQIPNLDVFIERALPHVTADVFGRNKPPHGNDRRTGPLRHAGDVGASFDRIALLPTVGPAAGDDRARGANGRFQAEVDRNGQYQLLDSPPGLEDLDKTFNDLLGRRLLGKLGDLNATEMRTQLQDKFARVKNVEQDKGNRDTALSAYQAESLYYGRTGQRLESLKEHVVEPIIREMKGRDLDLDSMDKFLYARHAVERNNVVGKLYPAGHDFNRATIDPTVKGASGMSNSEANSYIGRLRAAGKLPDYQAVARMVDGLNLRTRQTLFSGGLIDRDTFDALNSQYSYYVPLRGWQEGSNDDELPRQGKGMDTRAKAFQQAFGRKTLAASPLAYSIMQAEQAIVKAEKNKVGNVFLKFATTNPDPDLWSVNRPTPRKMVSKSTGMVHNTPTWDMNKPNVFITRVSGKAVLIEFHGKDGGNLARALKDMGSSNVHSAVRMMAAVTHTMARLATAWNPEFMIPNLVRDVGEAFINLGEQRQKNFVRKFAANILPAMKGSWMAIAEKTAAPGSSAQRYIDAFHEFDREGGRVRFFGMDDPDVIEKNVEKRLNRLSGGAINSIKDMGEKAGKALEIMGGGVENATRLAAYMAARDVGLSAPDAAMLARNLTVNFNKKGELGSAIGSAYMFANAGMQGQARMLTALHPKNRRVWMTVGALATAGVMSTSFNLGIGGSDQAGMANYMKIPSWERDKNIIIMGPGETYGKIPLPYGFAPFHVLGSHATTVLMGQEKPTAAAAAVFGSIASAFNPLGEEDSMIATVVPTALRPAVHIHYNENWTGKPLYPARDADKGKPESQQSFRTDTAASKAVAEGLNSLFGGDRYHPGWVDIHPGSIDHVFGAITGGVGKFFKNIFDTVANGWNGQPWEASKTPILRRFVGKIDHAMADSAAYYDARKDATEEANRVRQAKRDIKSGANEADARGLLDTIPGGRQKMIFDRADQQMRRLRTEEDRIKNGAQPYEEKKAALDAIRLQMRDVQNRARAESARLKGSPP